MTIPKEKAQKRLEELREERAELEARRKELNSEKIDMSLEEELIRHYRAANQNEDGKLIVERVVPIGQIKEHRGVGSFGQPTFSYRVQIKTETSEIEDSSQKCEIKLTTPASTILKHRTPNQIAKLERPVIVKISKNLVSRNGRPLIECRDVEDQGLEIFDSPEFTYTDEIDLECDDEARRIIEEHRRRDNLRTGQLAGLTEQIGNTSKKARTLEGYMDIQGAQLTVGRAEHRALDKSRRISSRPFYSLWVEGKQVFLYHPEGLSFLYSPKKSEPLVIKNLQVERMLDEESIRTSIEELGLQNEDFVNSDGIILTPEQQQRAGEIFEQVLNGVEILPSSKHPEGFRIPRRNGEEKEIEYRHWGQEFLATQDPEEIVVGQLLGSGGSYKAYKFGDRTIVEFDQEDRATYLFDTQYFEGLRVLNRARILQSNPEGFNGRVVHHQNRDAWKSRVTKFLNPQTTLEERVQGD